MKIIESRNKREGLFCGRTTRADERKYAGRNKRRYGRLPAEYGGLRRNKSSHFRDDDDFSGDRGVDPYL